MSTQNKPAQRWEDDIYDCFVRHNVSQIPYVPDAGHAHLIRRVHDNPHMRPIVLTTEEEGVASSCGAWLGGQKSVLLMQSSGVGNTVNAIASIVSSCQFPLFMIVTMRGQYGESNPWQMPMGQAVVPVLKSLGMHVFEVETDEEAAEAIEAGLKMAFVSKLVKLIRVLWRETIPMLIMKIY